LSVAGLSVAWLSGRAARLGIAGLSVAWLSGRAARLPVARLSVAWRGRLRNARLAIGRLRVSGLGDRFCWLTRWRITGLLAVTGLTG